MARSLSLSLSLPAARNSAATRNQLALAATALSLALAVSVLWAAPAHGDADLGISKLDAPDPVATSAAFDYVLRLTNYGPDTATGVTVIDTLPATSIYGSSAGAGWSCGHDGSPTGGVVTCTRASLAMTVEDGHSEITINVTAPGSAQSLTNNASISAVSPADPYGPNNTVAHGTTIQAPPAGGGICWAVDDNGGSSNPDGLATILKNGTGRIDRGPLVEPANGNAAVDGIEAISFGPFAGGPNLYAADDGRLGTISLTATNPAQYTNIGSFGSGTGQADGDAAPETITFDDVDGLAFHPQTLEGWGTQREGGNDLIFAFQGTIPAPVPTQILTRGRFPDSNDSDGLRDDFIMINPSLCANPEDDIDDLAISNDGRWFVQIDNNGANQQLAELEIVNGIPTGQLISCLPLMDACGTLVEDMEGTGIDQAGEMWGTTGNGSNNASGACGGNRNDDRLWLIDPFNTFDPPGPVTAAHLATRRGDLRPAGTDWEGSDCRDLSASGINTITGTVYFDGDQNALLHALEIGEPGVTVNLYSDENNNGVVDGGDLLVQTTTTNSNGGYSFTVLGSGNYVLAVATGTLPAGAVMTTNNIEEADFTGNGFTDANNDFGFIRALDFDWGDLPDPVYPTLSASNGPNHEISSPNNVFLGGAPDSETNGQPNASGTGDDGDLDGDDDDGVTFDTPLTPGNVADITVTSSGTGVLNAWIDFNSDGDFSDPGEQIAANLALAAGANLLDNIAVPADATGTMAARFRVTNASGQGGGSPTGPATTGEVEDYVLGCIGNFVWNDLDGDGIQDGGAEVGVQGVTVSLLSPVPPFLPLLDGNGALVTTTTDSNGNYEFCGLPTVGNSGLSNPGQYRVLFDRPASFSDFSPANQGGNDALDSDADQDTLGVGIEGLAPLDSLPPITLVAGQLDVSVDAGLRAVTAALITSAGAYVDGGTVVFEFSTGYEALTGGFEVLRYQPELGDYVPVTQRQVAALLGAPQGGVYRVVDETAPLHSKLRYVIVEHQTDGRSQAYGPYSVEVGRRGARAPQADPFAARAHKSSRLTARVAAEQSVDLGKGPSSRRGAALSGNLRPAGNLRDAGTLEIGVTTSGLYRLTATEIAEALGLAPGTVGSMLSSGRVSIENRGREIAWLQGGKGEPLLYFYGEAIDSLYTLNNVYQLRLGKAGRTMSGAEGKGLFAGRPGSTFTSTELFEQDVIPAINSTLETEIDHWYWSGMNAAGSDTIRTFEIAAPDAMGGSATLRVRLAGASNGGAADDHHAIVRVNGVEIGTAAWGGMSRHEAEFSFQGSLLTATTTLEIEGTLDGNSTESIFFIDGFELSYARAYRAVEDSLRLAGDGNSEVAVGGFSNADLLVLDLGQPAAPKVVTSARVDLGDGGYRVSFRPADATTPYLATTQSAALRPAGLRRAVRNAKLRAPHHRYDHVVIAPEAWRQEAEALAAHHGRRGMRSLAVSLEEIYSTFSHGIVTPWAIRDFLTYAHNEWSQGPEFVVLAGRGTLDPRDLLGGGDHRVPVVLVGTAYGLIPSDNLLADLEGGDFVPEVAIGRLPIVSAAELATYVAKLEAYDSADGGTPKRALLLADNPDAAGDFPRQSDDVGAVLESFQKDAIYLSRMTPSEARAALLEAWNRGAQLINYVGHGGVTQAAAEGLLRVNDMDALSNGDRLPIVSALTCVLGRSDIPNLESLAEALVTDVDGGAIAVWAPSGVSLSGAAHDLNLLYAATLDSAPPSTPLGSIVLRVLREFAAEGGLAEMLNTYGIVGDPAVQLP